MALADLAGVQNVLKLRCKTSGAYIGMLMIELDLASISAIRMMFELEFKSNTPY